MKKSLNTYLITSVLVIFFNSAAIAQYTEVGGGIGAFTYTGDLSPNLSARNAAPGGFVYYRMNLNEVVSLKLGLTGGKIRGNDKHPIDILAANRGASFDITLIEASSVLEYYFLDYKNPHSKIRWSPYFFGGLGLFRYFGKDKSRNDFGKTHIAIPFGVGIKQLIGKRFAVGGEFGLRKTFIDNLDGVSDGDVTLKNYQYGNPSNKDWYYFLGFSVTYILYEIPCPFKYVPNRYEYN